MTDRDKQLREALKQDFRKLYVIQFTTDWKAQRLVRETEIDIMSLDAIMQAAKAYADERDAQERESAALGAYADVGNFAVDAGDMKLLSFVDQRTAALTDTKERIE